MASLEVCDWNLKLNMCMYNRQTDGRVLRKHKHDMVVIKYVSHSSIHFPSKDGSSIPLLFSVDETRKTVAHVGLRSMNRVERT